MRLAGAVAEIYNVDRIGGATMRAFAINHYGEAVSVHELSKPVPGPGEILVRVRNAGVNPIDWKSLERLSGDTSRTFPLVVGQDFAGLFERGGQGDAGFSSGDRVFGIARGHGAYAEYTTVPVADKTQPIARIPAGLSDAQAAALPTPGLTALAGLDALGVTSDTTLLIIGASGAVGGFAVQMARARNAHVIGTASSRNHAAVESLGAHEVIDYDRVDTVAAVKRAHAGGIDAVLDLASPREAIERIASALRPGGRIASTIHAVDESRMADRGLRGTNITIPASLQSSHAGLDQLASLVISGTISVRIQAEMPLSGAAEALQLSKEGKITGKIILQIS
jgi:NADPH:quinone reductase-like Zn-dependent oxidoreductase